MVLVAPQMLRNYFKAVKRSNSVSIPKGSSTRKGCINRQNPISPYVLKRQVLSSIPAILCTYVVSNPTACEVGICKHAQEAEIRPEIYTAPYKHTWAQVPKLWLSKSQEEEGYSPMF